MLKTFDLISAILSFGHVSHKKELEEIVFFAVQSVKRLNERPEKEAEIMT